MKFTKLSLLTAVCGAGLLASATVFAAADFEAAKAEHLANAQARAKIESDHIACMTAATDHNGLKACHETAQQAHKALATQVKSENAASKAEKAAKKQAAAPAAAPAPTAP